MSEKKAMREQQDHNVKRWERTGRAEGMKAAVSRGERMEIEGNGGELKIALRKILGCPQQRGGAGNLGKRKGNFFWGRQSSRTIAAANVERSKNSKKGTHGAARGRGGSRQDAGRRPRIRGRPTTVATNASCKMKKKKEDGEKKKRDLWVAREGAKEK